MKAIVHALAGARYVLVMTAALLVTVTVLWSSSAHAASSDIESTLEEKTSREGAVTVKVTPRSLAPGAQGWDFDVTLDTHTQPLTEDLVDATTLIDAAGNVHAPIGWEGDPPGGHHRQGLLRFRPPTGDQGVVELRMQGVGGIPVRVFRWQLR